MRQVTGLRMTNCTSFGRRPTGLFDAGQGKEPDEGERKTLNRTHESLKLL